MFTHIPFRVSTAKQSKSPFSAAHWHARLSYLSYLRSTRYSSMWRWPFLAAHEAVRPGRCGEFKGAWTSSCKYLRHSRWPFPAANAHATVLIGHLFATQYFTISRLPCSAAAQIVPTSHSHFFSSRTHLSNSSLFVWATFQQNHVSFQRLGHNDLFSHANSKVDIEDISLTLNVSSKSPARVDLLINFLVSVFTSYKNFTSVAYSISEEYVGNKYHRHSRSNSTHLSPPFVFSALSLLSLQKTWRLSRDTNFSSSFSSSFSKVFLIKCYNDLFFVKEEKMAFLIY